MATKKKVAEEVKAVEEKVEKAVKKAPAKAKAAAKKVEDKVVAEEIEVKKTAYSQLIQCYQVTGPAPHNGYMNFPLLDGHSESVMGSKIYHTNCNLGCKTNKLPVILRP